MTTAGFSFTDVDSGDEGYVGVRAIKDGVGITLSLKGNGDIEVFLPTEDANRMARIITQSINHPPID